MGSGWVFCFCLTRAYKSTKQMILVSNRMETAMNKSQIRLLEHLLANEKIHKDDVEIVNQAIDFGYETLSVKQHAQLQKYIDQGYAEDTSNQTKASVEDNLALFDLLGGKMQCSSCADEDNYVKEKIEKNTD